jgi:hypothetical protein
MIKEFIIGILLSSEMAKLEGESFDFEFTLRKVLNEINENEN